MIKVPRPERVEEILPAKIDYKDYLNFNGDCMDPITLRLIITGLDYSMEASSRRLDLAASIWPEVKASGEKVLSLIRGIRDSLQDVPVCAGKVSEMQGNIKLADPFERAQKEAAAAKKPSKKTATAKSASSGKPKAAEAGKSSEGTKKPPAQAGTAVASGMQKFNEMLAAIPDEKEREAARQRMLEEYRKQIAAAERK